MLFLYQTGSVKIGEVIRYRITYTPSQDRILPAPECLRLRIRNTSAIALRAAFVHGPYTISVAAYPAHFSPDEKFENPHRYGVPEFEPMLKASGTWDARLIVPDTIRSSAGEGQAEGAPEESVSWVVEVISQVVFSSSAAVHYDVVLGRDEKSLDAAPSGGATTVMMGTGKAQAPEPGRVRDFLGEHVIHGQQLKGVYTRAVLLKVDDTASLWNKPELPGWDEAGWMRAKLQQYRDAPVESWPAGVPGVEAAAAREPAPKKQKKVHLVVLTHGLHSNLGADMLFLKESIDAAARKAKVHARVRRSKVRAAERAEEDKAQGGQNEEATRKEVDEEEAAEDGEEVVVRGFAGNATKTAKGIKYLGKRLARYILALTYPDQPSLPTAKAASEAIAHTLKAGSHKLDSDPKATHKHSSVRKKDATIGNARLYKVTKISFIGHSLGGLVQTYAIAYIQKHSPRFFDLINPINFISMASPLLGLNHENPLYVKFALDFGLVGRTGQDLGLTWRAPTIARSGWGALVSNLGENAHKRMYGDTQPESKPLLRILPTGPAHVALKKFRNRTVYSNVVNDGIVPLRTSCLLFLDWQGLGRVEKARREAGLVETVVGFGWAELTGANVNQASPRIGLWSSASEEDDLERSNEAPVLNTSTGPGFSSHHVPLPPSNATLEDDRRSFQANRPSGHDLEQDSSLLGLQYTARTNNSNPFTGFFNLFRNNDRPKPPVEPSEKQKQIYQRSQTLKSEIMSDPNSPDPSKPRVTAGHELSDDNSRESGAAPPKTSFFESAGDLLNPKLPSVEYLIDPSKRPRTIFHDRVYHPEDIPPPPLKKRSLSSFSPRTIRKASFPMRSPTVAPAKTFKTDKADTSSPFPWPGIPLGDSAFPHKIHVDDVASRGGNTAAGVAAAAAVAEIENDKAPKMALSPDIVDSSQMKVEEKIARAYHRGLSWRKVLVKLEPDAHNNMVVRRMFANAFGWPVVHHLVEAHFSDSATARMRDEDESSKERAKSLELAPDEHGGETRRAESRGKKEAEAATETGTGTGKDGARSDDEDRGWDRAGLTVPRLGRPKQGLGTPRGLSIQASNLSRGGSSSDDKALDSAGLSSRSEEEDKNEVDEKRGSQAGRPLEERPRLSSHEDSVVWTERDWLDSEEEEANATAEQRKQKAAASAVSAVVAVQDEQRQAREQADLSTLSASIRTTNSLGLGALNLTEGWNWSEKIVGKGVAFKEKKP